MSQLIQTPTQEQVIHVFTFRFRDATKGNSAEIREETVEIGDSMLGKWILKMFGMDLYKRNFSRDQHKNKYELVEMQVHTIRPNIILPKV